MSISHRFCIAPMMQCTDIHDRFLFRLISKKAFLYTEMVTTGAIIHGISKALTIFEPDLKIILKKAKLTTRDSRTVERKKYGHRKARRSFQFSKR